MAAAPKGWVREDGVLVKDRNPGPTEYWREVHQSWIDAIEDSAGTRQFANRIMEFTAELREALESEMGLSRTQRAALNTMASFATPKEQ